MARVKDITDKLSFDGNPCLRVRGIDVEVNADAPTVLRAMNLMSANEDNSVKSVNDAYELLFPDESKEKIKEMKLPITDWMTLVHEAVSLIIDADGSRGEQ